MTGPIEETKEGVVLNVTVQPKARRTAYVGRHGDALKFQVAAPPVEGAANEALCAFLAERFHLPKKAVVVQTGRTGRRKRIVIKGISLHDVQNVFPI